MAKALLDLVRSEFSESIVSTHAQHGDETLIVKADAWFAVHQFLREDARAACDMLTDLTVVDFPDREPRFEIVTHVYSLHLGHRLRVKTAVGDEDGDDVNVDSLSAVWASANWMEREAYDMFGVNFSGHPDLRRILLYPEFEGFPLRKDYPADKIQPLVPFREVDNNEKVAPFGTHEGMSFGRQTHNFQGNEDAE